MRTRRKGNQIRSLVEKGVEKAPSDTGDAAENTVDSAGNLGDRPLGQEFGARRVLLLIFRS